MEYNLSAKPQNTDSLGVIGYLIIINNQVHSYEVEVLEEYLRNIDLNLNDTGLNAIIDGKDDAISLDVSIQAFRKEDYSVQKAILYVMTVIAYVDASFDKSESEVMKLIRKIRLLVKKNTILLKKMQKMRQMNTEKIKIRFFSEMNIIKIQD